MTEVYALLCPITGDVRYIGKANNTQKRLKSHIRAARDPKKNHTPVYCWINQLGRQGLQPIAQVVAIAIGDDWQTLERELIAQWRKDGRLLNVADGGDEPHCAPEQRKNLGAALNARMDDMALALRKIACTMGSHIKYMQEAGKHEKAKRYAEALKSFQAAVKKDRESVFYIALQNERLRGFMGVELV